MYSNTLGYIKCQTYIEAPYLVYNYIFLLLKMFANYLLENEMKLCISFMEYFIQ